MPNKPFVKGLCGPGSRFWEARKPGTTKRVIFRWHNCAVRSTGWQLRDAEENPLASIRDFANTETVICCNELECHPACSDRLMDRVLPVGIACSLEGHQGATFTTLALELNYTEIGIFGPNTDVAQPPPAVLKFGHVTRLTAIIHFPASFFY